MFATLSKSATHISLMSFSFRVFPKSERGRIDAVAHAGWGWAIGKNVPQVRITVSADEFGSAHTVAFIE